MKIQFKILLFIACLNLAFGLVVGLALPGTEWVLSDSDSPLADQANATVYEAHFNATDISSRWGENIISGIPIIGDIFSGFNFLCMHSSTMLICLLYCS